MTVNDEGAHFLKAYSLSGGKISGRECAFPADIINKSHDISSENFVDSFTDKIEYSDTRRTTCGSAGNYSPIMHLPQAVGITFAKIFNGSTDSLVLAGRIANAVFYSLSLYWIIRRVKIGKWVFATIGLFPLMIHTAGSLSGDVMNNIIVMGSIAYTLNLFVQKVPITRRQTIVLMTIAVLLALSKATNVILLLPLVALPKSLFRANVSTRVPFNLQKWLLLAICGAVALITVILAQNILGSALFFREPVENPLAQDPLRFFYILYNTYLNPVLGYGDLLMRGVVGEFSSFKYHLPTFLIFTEFTVLLIALLYRQRDEPSVDKKTITGLALCSVVTLALFIITITYALYSAWAIQPNRLGTGAIYADGVQGRYFTAALTLLIPIGIWIRRYMRIYFASSNLLGIIVLSTSILCLSFYVVQTFLVFN